MTQSRPNLLLFMPDQLRADAVGAFGNPVVQTPNVDALAADGIRFSNAYSQHSVCAQSRISTFTGWYPHVAGHRTLEHLLAAHEPNVFRRLRDGGYHVALAGARGDMMAPGVTPRLVEPLRVHRTARPRRPRAMGTPHRSSPDPSGTTPSTAEWSTRTSSCPRGFQSPGSETLITCAFAVGARDREHEMTEPCGRAVQRPSARDGGRRP